MCFLSRANLGIGQRLLAESGMGSTDLIDKLSPAVRNGIGRAMSLKRPLGAASRAARATSRLNQCSIAVACHSGLQSGRARIATMSRRKPSDLYAGYMLNQTSPPATMAARDSACLSRQIWRYTTPAQTEALPVHRPPQEEHRSRPNVP
jgi:hypothetical protein